jgi:hydroxyethylthiazole kinase
MIKQIKSCDDKIQRSKLLILNLTNYVNLDIVANVLLAVGAAPVMSEEKNELDELISYSSSVSVNIGMLKDAFLERVEHALKMAQKLGKTVVLDPVGCGVYLCVFVDLHSKRKEH